MKAPDERGLTAQRLRDVRLRAGFTNQKAAAAHVRSVTGVVGLTDSQWASYESGDPRRPFQAKHRAAIESVFGALGDQAPPEQPATPDLAALISAIERQQEQIVALQGMVQSLVRAIETDRQGPPWLDDAVPAAARYILSAVRPGKASEP